MLMLDAALLPCPTACLMAFLRAGLLARPDQPAALPCCKPCRAAAARAAQGPPPTLAPRGPPALPTCASWPACPAPRRRQGSSSSNGSAPAAAWSAGSSRQRTGQARSLWAHSLLTQLPAQPRQQQRWRSWRAVAAAPSDLQGPTACPAALVWHCFMLAPDEQVHWSTGVLSL